MDLLSVLVALLCVGAVVAWVFRRSVDSHIQTPQVPPQAPLNPVLRMSAMEISRRLRSGSLTSVEVVSIFIDHIRAVNPYINAIVYQRFDEALEEARIADGLLQRIRKATAEGVEVPLWDPTEEESRRLNAAKVTYSEEYNDRTHFPPSDYPANVAGAPKVCDVRGLVDPGWLLGVPCTVKECMQVVGCPQASGNPIRQQQTPKLDSPVVSNLRRCGAIVLGVTNTSELCMWMESHNQVYGICRNPYDTRSIVGGSSGGEGAAVGAMLAPFGVGSDIGGSIRMPCFFNGIFGHKASTRLVCNYGQYPTVEASGHFLMTTGPMCHHAEDLFPLLQVMIRGGPLSNPKLFPPCPKPPSTLYIPTVNRGKAVLAVGAKKERLRVYCIEDLGLFNVYPSPSNVAAVRECGRVLEQESGAEVVYLNLRNKGRCSAPVPKGWSNMFYTMDMWASLMVDTEKPFTELMSRGRAKGMLNPFLEMARWFCRRSDHTLAAILLMMYEVLFQSLTPHFIVRRSRIKARKLQHDIEAVLGDSGVIITPTYPHPAPQHHTPTYFPLYFQYTALFNALQLPATAVPVWSSILRGTEKAPDPLDARPYRPLEGVDLDERPDIHLPRGVQVVSSWGQDVLSISVASELERHLGGYKAPSWA